MYLDGDISFEVYLKYIFPLYELSLKKKVSIADQNSEESSESDAESDSNSNLIEKFFKEK